MVSKIKPEGNWILGITDPRGNRDVGDKRGNGQVGDKRGNGQVGDKGKRTTWGQERKRTSWVQVGDKIANVSFRNVKILRETWVNVTKAPYKR